MGINISYNPSAGAVSGLGVLGGQGEYAKWLNGYLNNQYQFGANLQLQQQHMAMDRLNALSQMANQNQLQQNQQQFQMQYAPQQAALEAQQQAYQSQLGSQADYQRQMVGAQLGSQQSRQDFAEQQQLNAEKAAQDAQAHSAQLAQQQQGQLDNWQSMQKFQQDQQTLQQFQTDPLATHKQNIQQYAGGDMQRYSQDQQAQMADAQKQIAAMQDYVAQDPGNTGALSIVAPQARAAMATLARISANPANPEPPTLQEQISKKITMGFKDPSTGQIVPGTEKTQYTLDPKGTPIVVRGTDAQSAGGADESGLVDAKVQGQNFKNEDARPGSPWHRSRWINTEFNARGGKELAYEPEKSAILRNQISQEYDQILAQGKAVTQPGPAATPPAPAINPQNPGGAPQQQPQITPQEPQGAQPAQQQSPEQATAGGNPALQSSTPASDPVASIHPSQITDLQTANMVYERLRNTPQERWSKHDLTLWRDAMLQFKKHNQQPQQQMAGAA